MKSTLWTTIFLLLTATSSPAAAASSKEKPWKPCTARSPATERFFDLNPIHRAAPEKGKKAKEGEEGSWHARGYDYGANFTINFCGPVVEELEKVQDLGKSSWKNVSAFYEKDGKQYAIGLENAEPVFRGTQFLVNYTGGSLCPSPKSKRSPTDLSSRAIVGDDDEKKPSKSKDDERRKSTIIAFLCEKDPLAKTKVSFLGTLDECTYSFLVRSPAACGGIEPESQALSPGGVFGVIILIAVIVYLVGGCVYQRTVMHQRGWRQLPNYTMWAGAWSFIKDMFVILTSSCARFLPSRRGYSRVSLGNDSGRHGRRNEDENRLIDNLDEEWDD